MNAEIEADVNIETIKINTMRVHEYKSHFISAVVKRSGICKATVEIVAAALFDEIRFQLTEGCGCVPIDSFGTFAVTDVPERQRRYTYGGRDEVRTYAPTQRLKFAPAKNMRRELEGKKFDPTRRAFSHNPADPKIRTKKSLGYNKRKQVFIGKKEDV